MRSSFAILKEQQEKQKGKIVTLEKKIEGMSSNATESQKRIVMLEEGMKSKMEKVEKDLATLVENQKTAMPSISGVSYFVGAVTVVILIIMQRRV